LNRETTKDVVAEIPLITDTMLLLAVTPLLTFHPHKPPSGPPHQPDLPSFVNNHSYMQTKSRKMQVVLLNARDFLIPSYFLCFERVAVPFFLSSIFHYILSLCSSCTG